MSNSQNVNHLNRLRTKLAKFGLLVGAMVFSAVGAASAAPQKTLQSYSLTDVQIEQQQILVPAFNQYVQVQVFLPPNYSSTTHSRFPSLYVNDGQDAEAVALSATLKQLLAEQKIRPVIVVAVSMLPDRMGTYGFSDRTSQQSLPAQTRFGPVGLHAHDYSDWLAKSLVPSIDAQYRTIAKPVSRAIVGWSLGAANAFNIGWNYPDVFSRVGAFSPSFWLSAKTGDPTTAIVQSLLTQKPLPPNFSLWLAVGDAEETDDRDGDGVIDVVDDAQGVIEALSAKVLQSGTANAQNDIQLKLFPGGQHNQQTWKQMLPEFLLWAYPLEN
ncbi:MAG: esterase family protein [Arenimonas sp.]|nr:esterase family protein [Arenimonas sp.]